MFKNSEVAKLLAGFDLGSTVAEKDALLENARIETSAFTDLLHDKVDLIPGTKGSGKSALYRMIVDFYPHILLENNRIVIAHGSQTHDDEVFHVYKEQFEKLNEEDFVNFWCVYVVSLANAQFVTNPKYATVLKHCRPNINAFASACERAAIPSFTDRKKPLRDVLGWILGKIRLWKPKVTVSSTADGTLAYGVEALNFEKTESVDKKPSSLPYFVDDIRLALEAILQKSGLSLWLMIDRLDEIFPRRSAMERKALRGLLRTLKIFESKALRVKVFLRDDIFKQVVEAGEGFVALTHVTARRANTLRWSEEQILSVIIKRFVSDDKLATFLQVNRANVDTSPQYRLECFYQIFPKTVPRGSRPTLYWLYNHCADGNGVVTPRDVIYLLNNAMKNQYDSYVADPGGGTEHIINAPAIVYGHRELSKYKVETYLQAEFPHWWTHIRKFIGGKSKFAGDAMRDIIGSDYPTIAEDLCSIGFLQKKVIKGKHFYQIPILYRADLKVVR